jgi:hypothetical protein
VHHEHRDLDLEAASRYADASLRLPASPARQAAARHRLARLERKLRHPDAGVGAMSI